MQRMLPLAAAAALLLASSAAGFAASPAAGAAGDAGAPGRLHDASGDIYTRALNLLAAKGYLRPTDLQAQNGGVQASAVHDGRSVRVLIDPSSGSVRQESPAG